MKKLNEILKNTGLLALFLLSTVVLHAQAINNSPIWISKDVQKVANKKTLQDELFGKSNITAESVNATWVISKGIQHQTQKNNTDIKGNIKSEGTPSWVISKGVLQRR